MLNPIQLLFTKAANFVKTYYEKGSDILRDSLNEPQYLEMLDALEYITLDTLGVNEYTYQTYFVAGKISCISIFDTTHFSIGFFCIPADCEIPLHDHPGMLVTSKVMSGSIKRKSLDLVDTSKQFELPNTQVFDIEDNPFTKLKLEAILEGETIISKGTIVNLTPYKGNIHSFKAITDSIIFDVITPNYDQKYRFCNFYKEIELLPKKQIPKKKQQKAPSKTEVTNQTNLQYLYTPPKLNFVVQNYYGLPIN